jgi:HrpA-like RNA helicase
MPRHSPPEIVNTALEGVVLVLKAMGVDKVRGHTAHMRWSSQATAVWYWLCRWQKVVTT